MPKTAIWVIVVLFVLGMALWIGHCARAEKSQIQQAEYDSILTNSDQVQFVVVVKKEDKVFVLSEGTKQLVFEFNSAKPADAVDYRVYNNLLIEAKALAEKQKNK